MVIENLDWADVFEKYDSEDTVFYCDPPYVGYEDCYLVNTIDHEALVVGLAGLEGDWIYSYEDLPGTFEDVSCLTATRSGSSTAGSVARRQTPKSG